MEINRDRLDRQERAMNLWDIACCRFLALGKDESGVALVTTLAVFMFMYLMCMGVYAVSTAVRERIHLQNAADAASYSAAVVQADTLSRIATINRAMSWTYADMTKLQMDYIVCRWLEHTCEHYERDMNGGTDEKGRKRDSLKEYNKNSFLYKLHIIASPFGPNAPCSRHKSFGIGYYIGADEISPLMVHLNGRDASKYRLPKGAGKTKFPKISSGHTVFEAEIRARLLDAYDDYLRKYADQLPRQLPRLYQDVSDIARLTAKVLGSADMPSSTRLVLLDNLAQVGKLDLSMGNESVVSAMMKTQINLDKLAIAKMNVCERYLALDLPDRIDKCVHNVIDAHLGDTIFTIDRKQIQYMVDRSKAIAEELVGQLPYAMNFGRDLGYLRDIFNTTSDENRFLGFSGHGDIYDTFDSGINQWFVRGDGSQRTEGAYGIQRCYKHMTKSWIAHDRSNDAAEPLSSYHATHSPLEPTSWNTKKLEDADPSCALFSEWMWWSDTWYCFRIYIPYPPGYITIHLNFPHYQEIWPSKPSCPHHSKPGLLGLKSGQLTTPDWRSFFNVGSLTSKAKKACIKKRKWRPPKFRSHDYTPNLDFGLGSLFRKLAAIDNLLGNYEAIEKYHDGCFIWPDLLSPRDSFFKFTGYSRLYADDPHLYNGTYVGFKAMPLVLDASYFGKFGTISVGIRRENENVFLRLLGEIAGIFKAFDPDWNGTTYSYAFSSAKAGYKYKNESAVSRMYKVHWNPLIQSWNLCQSDWDAVFVPVRRSYSQAIIDAWLEGESGILEDWVRNPDCWRSLSNGNPARNIRGSDRIKAPSGMNGQYLDWRGLGSVIYH